MYSRFSWKRIIVNSICTKLFRPVPRDCQRSFLPLGQPKLLPVISFCASKTLSFLASSQTTVSSEKKYTEEVYVLSQADLSPFSPHVTPQLLKRKKAFRRTKCFTTNLKEERMLPGKMHMKHKKCVPISQLSGKMLFRETVIFPLYPMQGAILLHAQRL